MNEHEIMPYFYQLYDKIIAEDFVIDKTGAKQVELLGVQLELDPLQSVLKFGNAKQTSIKYAKKEIEWYDSQDLHVDEIAPHAKLWDSVCSKHMKVNSNYGWAIYSEENYFQFEHCIDELLKNKNSRRAEMIYQRPSMWRDYKKDGMNDFICTDGVQLFIRNNKLIYVIKQRSCDFIYGFFNDFYWHCTVYSRAIKALKSYNLDVGKIAYFIFSLHVYEKHFKLLENIVKNKLEDNNGL